LVAEYAVPQATTPPPNVSYLTEDTLGSPRIITGKNGEVISRRDFLPFGEEIASSELNRKEALGYNYGSTTRQAFTGYEKDSESGLEFAQNRYYSNKLGRFTTPDPMMASGYVGNPQTWNRYAYTLNNPLNLTDPFGLDPTKEKKPWWYHPCAGCSPVFGTGYTDASQLIQGSLVGGFIYFNAAFSDKLWALNPITGAYHSFANTAEGLKLAISWMAAGGATALAIEVAFPIIIAGILTATILKIYQDDPSLPVPTCIGGSACSSAATHEAFGELISGKQTWKQKHNQKFMDNAMASNEIDVDLVPAPPMLSNAPANTGNAQPPNDGKKEQDPNKPNLKSAHKELNKNTLEHIRKWSTEKIINSLKPGSSQALTVKPDGTIVQGNHRIEVLRERGVNVNQLPRETYTPSKLPELGTRKEK
jgi:RHS repeat-associated protein